MKNKKLEAALALAAQGYRVFPTQSSGPNAKAPCLGVLWQKYASENPEQLKVWWRENPDANPAIALSEDIVVIDEDPRNGSADTLALLEILGDELPDTFMRRTAGGGTHRYYRKPADAPRIKNDSKGKTLGPGIDIKTLGGYVVAGGEIDGKPYAPLNEAPLAPLPAWAIERAKSTSDKQAGKRKRIHDEDDDAIEAAERWLKTGGTWDVPDGQRNDTAYGHACMLGDFGVEEDTCLAMMAAWNLEACHPPLDDNELATCVHQGMNYGQNELGCKHPALEFEAIDIEEPKDEAPKGDAPKDDAKDERPQGLYFISAADAAAKARTHSAAPLIKGLIDQSCMSVVYGESGCGKSFAELDKDYHIAAGKPWNGRKVTQGPVLYLALEGTGGIYKRLAALAQHYGSLEGVPLYVVPCPVNLLRASADLPQLVEMAKQIKAQHGQPVIKITVDTLSRAIAGGDESSSVDMGAYVKNIDKLRNQTTAHLASIHHCGKDKARGARGHSLLRAATDTEIEIASHVKTVKKQRDGADGIRFRFRLKPVTLWRDEDGDCVTSCHVEYLDNSASGFELPLTGQEADALRALTEAVQREADKAGVPPGEWRFNWQFAQRVWASKPGLFRKSAAQSAAQWRPSEDAVRDLIGELGGKNGVMKVDKNQWVIIDAA
jgi:hypothetical protein